MPCCPTLQSHGRSLEKNATCKTYISANDGCGFSWPSLSATPGPNTKWTFEPAPGGQFNWFIQMSVSI